MRPAGRSGGRGRPVGRSVARGPRTSLGPGIKCDLYIHVYIYIYRERYCLLAVQFIFIAFQKMLPEFLIWCMNWTVLPILGSFSNGITWCRAMSFTPLVAVITVFVMSPGAPPTAHTSRPNRQSKGTNSKGNIINIWYPIWYQHGILLNTISCCYVLICFGTPQAAHLRRFKLATGSSFKQHTVLKKCYVFSKLLRSQIFNDYANLDNTNWTRNAIP